MFGVLANAVESYLAYTRVTLYSPICCHCPQSKL